MPVGHPGHSKVNHLAVSAKTESAGLIYAVPRNSFDADVNGGHDELFIR